VLEDVEGFVRKVRELIGAVGAGWENWARLRVIASADSNLPAFRERILEVGAFRDGRLSSRGA